MRVLVTGGRSYEDREVVEDVLDHLLEECEPMVLIHGGAKGADALANAWAFGKRARGRSVTILSFPVRANEWRMHGPAAGPIRNARMIEQGKPDLCIAFPGGRGTADCIAQCGLRGVRVRVVTPALRRSV